MSLLKNAILASFWRGVACNARELQAAPLHRLWLAFAFFSGIGV